MNWRETLADAIGLDCLGNKNDVPFSVRTEGRIDWEVSSVQWSEPSLLVLEATSPQGLSATWRMRVFGDTRAVEIGGVVRNSGTAPVTRLRELWTLDADFQLGEAWGEPWVRTFNGVRFLPAYFPPDDFRYADRQLLRTSQVYTPMGIRAAMDGRPSGQDLPVMVVSGSKGDRGFAMFYEWAGLWAMGLTQAETPAAPTWPWRVNAGAGIWGLSLDLKPGEELPLPTLLLTAFSGDLRTGCNAIRRHIGRHVTPKLNDAPVVPPTSFNHWFALGNDYTSESLKPAVDLSAQCGIEYFIVDGGWFDGGFRRGIGNWNTPDPKKFPDGLAPFADYVRRKGLKFGLWFEPEYAHRSSEVYREHPEWFLTGPHTSSWNSPLDVHYPDGVRMHEVLDLGANFALMDFGLGAVRQYWVDRIRDAYTRLGVRWIRWDFNQPPRPFWEHAEKPGDVGRHQIGHVLGFYKVLDEIMKACPDLLIEQCASGGYRIELGTIRRGHTFWMNDHTTHTDIVRALQQGLNEILPGGYANTNLCQRRFDFDDYDFLSHAGGAFGISIRLWEAPPEFIERLTEFVNCYKSYRTLLNAEFSRPTGNPRGKNELGEAVWTDGTRTARMTFNAGGVRSATLRLDADGT